VLDSAAIELHQQALLKLSRDHFWILQTTYMGLGAVFTHFVARKYLRKREATPGALSFGAVAVMMLGTIGVFTKLWGYDHAPFAFGYGVSLVLAMVDPVVALAFLLANSLTRPWEFSDVAEMAFLPKTIFAVSMGSWAFHSARARKLSLMMNRPSVLFYSLAGWFLISALLAGDMMEGLAKYSGNVLIAVIVFVLASNAPKERDDIHLVERVIVVAITGLIAHAIAVTLSQPDYDFATFRLEDYGTVGNSNDLASLITLALPFAIVPTFAAAVKGKTSLLTRFFILGSAFVLCAGLVSSQSRGAILALVIAVIGFGVTRARNKKLALSAAAVCVVFVIAASTLLTFARDADDLEGSTNSRISFMIAGLNMGLRHPILGIGYDNFAYNWDAYSLGQTYEGGVRSAHNTWLIAFAENGFPGLLLLASLYFICFRGALRLKGQYPELVFVMISYGVAMTFLNHTYAIYPYLLSAMVLAATRFTEANKTKTAKPSLEAA
jgi:O-antigen ligase